MARLALEDRETNQLGSTEGFSAGDLEAVSCHDYPTAWNVRADPGTRASQLSTAVAKLSPTAFAPFPDQVWLDSLDENQLVYGCLDWPQPTISDPPFPKGAVYPDTPVLILDGEFDQATPVADARKAAQAWPASTFVEVANANHVTGQADSLDCTSVILQHFMTTTTTGDTSCVQRIPPVWVVPSFPTSLAAAPSIATTSGPGAPSPSAGQAAWVAGATIGDALARFANQVTYGADSGLYGGSFRTSASVYDDAPVTLRFIGDRFVPDAALSGRAVWNRTTSEISAGVTLTGPGGTTGTFQLSWSTAVAGASVTITGTFGGAAVTGTMPAPWLASP
jgi:hypothetical protein